VVSVQINQIIFGQIIKPSQVSCGSQFTDAEQGAIFGVGQLHGTALDQAQEIVPQCRFWLFRHWIHGWTNDPCFARDVSANAMLGPQPVFVNGNRRQGGGGKPNIESRVRSSVFNRQDAEDAKAHMTKSWRDFLLAFQLGEA
jgi:hypothetical protein